MNAKRNVRDIVGFGLVEVLIAVAILAIGILATALMQGRSLQFSSSAESLRSLTRIADGEVSWQQLNAIGTYAAFPNPLNVGDGDSSNDFLYACASDVGVGNTCSFEVVQCGVVGGAFQCSRTITDPQAYEIAVTVGDNRDNSVTLRSISTGTYVAGLGSTTGGSTGGSDDSGGGSDGGDSSGGGTDDGGSTGGGSDGGTDDGTGNNGNGNGGGKPPKVGGGNGKKK